MKNPVKENIEDVKFSAALKEAMLDQMSVASLPGSVFSFKPSQLIVRLAFIDFNSTQFLKKINNKTNITDSPIEKYVTKVVTGGKKVNKLD